jgi:hypothetical protein
VTGHLSLAALVDWWTDETPEAELDDVELHLMGCASCAAEAERVGAVVSALRATIPTVVDRERLEVLRRRGLRIGEDTFAPGVRKLAVFPPDLDLLIHRLGGMDLADAVRVELHVESESAGPIVGVPDVPFDRAAGEVLIACQQHFRDFPHDIVFRVRALAPTGEREAVFLVPHRFSA